MQAFLTKSQPSTGRNKWKQTCRLSIRMSRSFRSRMLLKLNSMRKPIIFCCEVNCMASSCLWYLHNVVFAFTVPFSFLDSELPGYEQIINFFCVFPRITWGLGFVHCTWWMCFSPRYYLSALRTFSVKILFRNRMKLTQSICIPRFICLFAKWVSITMCTLLKAAEV